MGPGDGADEHGGATPLALAEAVTTAGHACVLAYRAVTARPLLP